MPYELYDDTMRDQDIAYTYSVYWRESKTTFATRWDHYLRVFDPRIHALSLVNSVVIALFRTSECAHLRTGLLELTPRPRYSLHYGLHDLAAHSAS